jgi:RHS repeat-associated protein
LSDSLVGDANPFYGRVVYGPCQAIDQPLSVTRYEYRDNPDGAPAQTWPTFTLVPFWDYRGTPVFGLYADGTRSKPYGAGGTSCAPIGTGTTNRCVLLSWPFASSAYAQDRGLLLTYSWHGSLLQKKRDASGLTYMRNRMYDPSTGRFTQEDPIGLAGGMNAYGFAGGDPVNASDPFGLCPENDPDCVALKSAYEATGAMIGFYFGGGTGALETIASGGLAAPVAVAQTAGATVAGAALGRAVAEIVFFAKSATSGDSPKARNGRAAHTEFSARAANEGVWTNRAIPGSGGLRPDVIDFYNKIVYELKPAGQALSRGNLQLGGYIRALQEAGFGAFIGKLVHY